jgi:hypothetical protein
VKKGTETIADVAVHMTYPVDMMLCSDLSYSSVSQQRTQWAVCTGSQVRNGHLYLNPAVYRTFQIYSLQPADSDPSSSIVPDKSLAVTMPKFNVTGAESWMKDSDHNDISSSVPARSWQQQQHLARTTPLIGHIFQNHSIPSYEWRHARTRSALPPHAEQ